MLATLLRDGAGLPRDVTRARMLYERAAARNYPPSMYNLAAMIESGAGSDRDRAATLYRALACMTDERQIQPMATQRLRAMGEAPAACG
jgi:TPR repeat protein